MARLIAVALAALLVTAAAWLTPSYNSVTTTVSRLAVPGAPAAVLVDLAILLVASTCFLSAAALRRARAPLVVTGTAFVVAAFVHLDPGSPLMTWTHRAASGVAVIGLTIAPLRLARDYGAICWVAGVAELAMLVLAALLLATPFNAWGLWERALLSIALVWMVLIAFAKPSMHEIARAPSANISSTGSYSPVSKVTSAKP